LRHLAAFDTGSVDDLHAKLFELLSLPAADRDAIRAAARLAVEKNWSWPSIAARLLQ
jgi:glycosyltransferase involved in cell wall biosynthesis